MTGALLVRQGSPGQPRGCGVAQASETGSGRRVACSLLGWSSRRPSLNPAANSLPSQWVPDRSAFPWRLPATFPVVSL